jgi:hypothetical protein
MFVVLFLIYYLCLLVCAYVLLMLRHLEGEREVVCQE